MLDWIFKLFSSQREFDEYVIFLGATALGLAGAPWWMIFVSAALLSILSWSRWRLFAEHAKRSSAERMFWLTWFASLANALLFCSLAFALGAVLRSLFMVA